MMYSDDKTESAGDDGNGEGGRVGTEGEKKGMRNLMSRSGDT